MSATIKTTDQPVAAFFQAGRAGQESQRQEELRVRLAALELQCRSGAMDPKVYLDLALCNAALHQHDAALDALRAGAARLPAAGEIHYALFRRLHRYGLTQEALAAGRKARELMPADFGLQLKYELYLPRFYDSEEEIGFFHGRFQEGLEKCIAGCDLSTPEKARSAAQGLGSYESFYLGYQGHHDVSLLRRYGEFAHRIMSSAYPKWSKPRGRLPGRSKPRIGFVSSCFWRQTVGELFLGWLTQRQSGSYEAYCYYLGDREDSVTEAYRRASDHFVKVPDLEAACQSIEQDQPDVLVYTAIGMSRLESQLGALRLAPVQCVTWGHPVTTGLPTIDYFISSDLMEPPDAQEHYTEKLVRLPNLGICYQEPLIPRALLTKTRADFGLPDDAVVYLCCQSIFKYLPQYDALLAEIADAVPNARFVFLAGSGLLAGKLMARLERCFRERGRSASEVCHILPEQMKFDYWNLHLVSDVFLDTPGWSGGKSTLEAVACGLPIVTLPGPWMRQRHSYAILMRLGVPETIAGSTAEYVALAIKLGLNPALRREVAATMKDGTTRLFGDNHAPDALASAFIGLGT